MRDLSSVLCTVSSDDKYRAKEMCQTITRHWGYFKNDQYKTPQELADDYSFCKKNHANFLLNCGPLPDGTIEVCKEFFEFELMNDRASILWHEIYHLEHGHLQEASTTGNSVTLEMPTGEVLDGLNAYLDWYYKDSDIPEWNLEFLKESYINELLTEYNLKESSWYENEVTTYEAEKENGIDKSDYYEGLIDFQIWKYEQLANY